MIVATYKLQYSAIPRSVSPAALATALGALTLDQGLQLQNLGLLVANDNTIVFGNTLVVRTAYLTTDGTGPIPPDNLPGVLTNLCTSFFSQSLSTPVRAQPVESFGVVPGSFAGLRYWVRSDSGVMFPANAVSLWPDLSGRGNDFSQTTPSDRPAYNTGGLGDQPFVTYNGTAAQVLLGASGVFTAQPFTLYFVAQKNGATAGFLLDGQNTSRAFASFTTPRFHLNAGSAVNLTAGDLPLSGDVLAAVYDGVDSAGYENHSQAPVASGDAGTGFPDGPLTLGNQNSGTGAALVGNLYESFGYDGADSVAKIQELFAYAGARYGIAVS